MRSKAVMIGAGAVLLGFALGACSGDDNVTLYEPGEYKGPVDPLVQKQGSPEQQEALLARFKQVQTDR